MSNQIINTSELKSLKELGRIITGKTPPTFESKYFNGHYMFVSPKDLDYDLFYVKSTVTKITIEALKKYKNQVLPANSILFTSLSYSFGKIGIASENCLTNQQINSIVVNNENSYLYVYYLLRGSVPFIFQFNSGIDTPIVPKSVFEKIKLYAPSLSLQESIASILSTYDELIEVNNQRINLLEETSSQLYKEWFVRMRFPGYKNAKFVKGIPEGWEVGNIGLLYDVKSGFAFKSEFLGETGFPILKISNIQDSYIDLDNCQRYSGAINKRIEKFEICEGDLLIAMTGAQIGKIGLCYSLMERYFLNQRAGKFFSKKDILKNNAFLFFTVSSEYFRSMVENYGMGAAQPNISGEQIENIHCLIPCDDLLKKFTDFCDPIFKKISLLKTENTQLRQIRDRLLPRLISGKLQVKETKNNLYSLEDQPLPMAAEKKATYNKKY